MLDFLKADTLLEAYSLVNCEFNEFVFQQQNWERTFFSIFFFLFKAARHSSLDGTLSSDSVLSIR